MKGGELNRNGRAMFRREPKRKSEEETGTAKKRKSEEETGTAKKRKSEEETGTAKKRKSIA